MNNEKLQARLNTKYKSVPKIVAEFAKAHTNVKIELYYEE